MVNWENNIMHDIDFYIKRQKYFTASEMPWILKTFGDAKFADLKTYHNTKFCFWHQKNSDPRIAQLYSKIIENKYMSAGTRDESLVLNLVIKKIEALGFGILTYNLIEQESFISKCETFLVTPDAVICKKKFLAD